MSQNDQKCASSASLVLTQCNFSAATTAANIADSNA